MEGHQGHSEADCLNSKPPGIMSTLTRTKINSLLRFSIPIAFAILGLLALCAARSEQTKPVPSETDHTAWVQKCLNDFQAIKPGMTRSEVEARLHTDGGFQGVQLRRFVHPACHLFKVEVEFEVKGDANDQTWASRGKDKVVKVSKPYLEPMFMD